MVGATGFEPATSCSQSKCSSQAELRSDSGWNIHVLRRRRNAFRRVSAIGIEAVHENTPKLSRRLAPLRAAAELRTQPRSLNTRAFGWTVAAGMLDCFHVKHRAFRASEDQP